MMARTIKQISPLARIQIKEDTRDNNDLLLETSLEEVESVGDCLWELFEIEPQVERAVWHGLDDEAHGAESGDYVVAFFLLFVRKEDEGKWRGD